VLKDYVEACCRNGLTVGFYYSPPDWNFDRGYMIFLHGGARKLNPELPSLDADLKPRTSKKSQEEIAKHEAQYAALVNGQVEELLTRYGKIDLPGSTASQAPATTKSFPRNASENFSRAS
jgi:alpha-L-fucosidase